MFHKHRNHQSVFIMTLVVLGSRFKTTTFLWDRSKLRFSFSNNSTNSFFFFLSRPWAHNIKISHICLHIPQGESKQNSLRKKNNLQSTLNFKNHTKKRREKKSPPQTHQWRRLRLHIHSPRESPRYWHDRGWGGVANRQLSYDLRY